MGCSQTIGSLRLEVETTHLQAGQELTGVVHSHLSKPLKANSLSLEFTGTEFSEWEEYSVNDSFELEIDTCTRQTEVVNEKFPVFRFQEGVVDSGTSTFPFRINLPADILGTFSVYENRMRAGIEYQLTALIDNVGKQVKQSTVEIYVSQPLTVSIHSVESFVTTPISSWWCRKQGRILMKANFRKNAYMPGETAEIVVQIINTSRLDVVSIRATLFRIVDVCDDYNRFIRYKRALTTQQTNRRVSAGTNATENESITIQLPITNSKGSLQYMASVSRSFFECVYTIKVQANVKGCCGTTPEVEQVIVIYPEQLHRPGSTSAFLDCDPEVLSTQVYSGHDFHYQSSTPLKPEEKEKTE